jgi:hypothetical protein
MKRVTILAPIVSCIASIACAGSEWHAIERLVGVSFSARYLDGTAVANVVSPSENSWIGLLM